jgi:hypothetical protein
LARRKPVSVPGHCKARVGKTVCVNSLQDKGDSLARELEKAVTSLGVV